MKILLPLIILLCSCKRSQPQDDSPVQRFEKTPRATNIREGSIAEASGIADSKTRGGHVWVHEDSGNPPQMYLLNHDGLLADSVLIDGAVNRDWEDMQLSGGHIFIGDIGDNNGVYDEYTIYKFPEPAAGTRQVTNAEKIVFRYADSAHDAEAFVVDERSGDIFIITKRDARSLIYQLKFPQQTSSVNIASLVGELPFTGVVSADMSVDQKEIIVKTYTQLYYFVRKEKESVSEALSQTPETLDYQVEMQGEAVGFGIDNGGFYTLSERAFNVEPTLNFYRRR